MSGRPDDGSSLRRRQDLSQSQDSDLPVTGAWLLRVLSVVPFVMVGALAAIAAVVLPLLLIIGPGSLEPIWRVGRDRAAGWYVVAVAEVVGLELVTLGVVRVSILATMHGVRERPNRWLFPLVLAVALAVVVALVVLKVAMQASLARAGVSTADWLVTLFAAGGTAVLAALRVRQARRR